MDDINVSLLKIFYNAIMNTKVNKIGEYIQQQEKDNDEINLNNEKIRSYIINLCFDNIIDNKNNKRNYFLVNTIFERGYINKNEFSHDKLSKLYKKFTNNFILQKEKQKGIGINIELDMNKEDSLNSLENMDLPNLNLQIRFLSKIFYLYPDKVALIKFIKKEILEEKIIENKSVIIKEFLMNKDNFENNEFISKEESDFYINLFLDINYLEKRIEYSNQDNLIIKKLNQDTNNILYIKEFWNIFNIQKNKEIIQEMCRILYQLYNTDDNNLKQLITKCKEIFQYNLKENMNILYLLKHIITQSEKDFIIKIKSHYSLCKKNIIKINFEEKKDEMKDLYFFGNSTINQVYQYLNENDNTKNVVYYINNNIINEKEQNKTLNEFDKISLKISKKEIEKNNLILLDENKLTEKFRNVLKNWFNYFSKGKEKMTKTDLANCFNILSGKKEKQFTEKSNKIWFFLKKHSDNLEFILLDKFINYYYLCITNGDKEKVWKNIENMNLRNDLSTIPQIKEKKILPRYYLSNETEENKNLFLMNIFKQKYKNSLDKDIYDFIFFLSTEEKMYDYILKNFNTAENMKFSKRKDEYLYNLYIMHIIESIFEDVEFKNCNNSNFQEINFYEKDGDLYNPENNIELKNKFFIEFLKKNYSDLIDYALKNLEELNKMPNENLELQRKYVAIKLYQKNIELINKIYNYYNNIYFTYKKEEITFGKNSLKEFIETNKLSNEINEQKSYKELFFELMKFLDIYYIKESQYIEVIQELIDKSFFLFISLLFKHKAIYEDIKNNTDKSKLLDKIFNFIFTEDSQKNKQYIRGLMKINSYTEEIQLYLIDLTSKILTNFGEIKSNLILLYIFNNLWGTAISKVNLKNQIKETIIQVLYNILNTDSSNIKQNGFMQIISKFLENQKQFRDELMEGRYNQKNLYDLIYEQINKKEETKLRKKYEKFNNFKNKLLIENKEDKFLPYDNVKKEIEEIFNSKNNINNNEPNKNIPDFIMASFKSYNINNTGDKKIIGKLITSLKNLTDIESNEFNIYNAVPEENNKRISKTCPYVGIKNIGSLCYINSIMQQFYWISKFKSSILSANDNKPPDKSYNLTDDDNILHQTQRLFTFLSFSSFGDFIPQNFIFSIKIFGERINPNQMLDSSEFYLHFLDSIKTLLENTEYNNLIEDLFCGKLQVKKICSECSNTSFREEEFKSISLEVKDIKDIYQSLDNYISEEIIDDYNCDKCNKKVKLKKSLMISSLPNILVIHLKKMIFNNKGELEKINSKYDFPLELNIKNYSKENNKVNEDYYKYNLRGINIHKGTATGGHYISLIQTSKENNKWFLFDDSSVKEYDFNLYEEEFNKKDKSDSAYILFYESVQEKPMKTIFKENIPKQYLLEILDDNKTYENIYGNKVIDVNNELIKIFMDIIDNESFKLKEKKVTYYEIKDLIDIFSDLIINFYNNKNNRINPDKRYIKSFNNIIDKIFFASIYEDILFDSDKTKVYRKIKEKLFSDKNMKLIYTETEIKELNKKLYDLIHIIIKNNEALNIFSKTDFQEKISAIINKEKNISIYLYKILYEVITYFPNAELQQLDKNSFLDLFYKTNLENNESKENLEEICKIFDYYISKKNIIDISKTINREIKEYLNVGFFQVLFDWAIESLIITINKIQKNNIELSNRFNIEIIQELYEYCLKDKDNDKIRKNQIKLIKLIFAILEIKDEFILKRIQILLGFPKLVMLQSDNIIPKFGVNLLNNDINKEIFEYSNCNLIKKNNCVLSYLFPSCYYKNEENKLEEKDRCDLIYELINISLGLNNNNNDGNYFLFKTLYLMQSRSIQYDNLYQEMKIILAKTGNDKYDLNKIKNAEINAIQYVNYEIDSSINFIKGNKKGNKYNNINKPNLPNIYFKWGKIILDIFQKSQFIGCISNIFPFEIGKIEINEKVSTDKCDIFRFKFYTTYFTKEELTNIFNQNKPFIHENIKRDNPNLNDKNISNQAEKIFTTDFSIFKEKKDMKEFIGYIKERLKNNKLVVIKNENILNKYETKNTFIKYYIPSKDKKNNVIRAIITIDNMELDEINNCYLPEFIFNSINENQVTNIFDVHRLKNEFKFFENNDIGLKIKFGSFKKNSILLIK